VKRFSSAQLIFCFLLLLFIILATALPAVDRDLTMRLNQAAVPAFTDFMGRTLFQGSLPGGGDLVIFSMVALVAGYFLASFGVGPKWLRRWLPSCGFALFAAIASAVCLVHGIKWFVGRARPSEVVAKGLAYTDWYQFGPHYINEGIYRGSFPSGHTLAAFLIMLGAYVLAGDRTFSRKVRFCGWIVGVLALAYAGGMSIARAMALSHWLSDGVLGILLSWMVMHACYYWILKVPQQNRRPELRAKLPFLFEFRLALFALLITFGMTCLLLGLRGLVLLGIHPLLGLIPFGLGVGYWAGCRGLQLYRVFSHQLKTISSAPQNSSSS